MEDKLKLDELHQTVGHLKAQCHLTWLQLLELTVCLEHKFYPSQKPDVRLHSENSRSQKYQNTTLKIHRTHRLDSHSGHPRRSKTHEMRNRFQSFKVLSNLMKNMILIQEGRRTGHRHLEPKLLPDTRMSEVRTNDSYCDTHCMGTLERIFCQNFIYLLKQPLHFDQI